MKTNKSLFSFRKEIEKKTKYLTKREIHELFFNRREERAIFKNSNYLFSPCDGVITNFGKTKLENSLVEVKGKEFTLFDLLGGKENIYLKDFINDDFLFVVIFMTYYNDHNLYAPYNAISRQSISLPPIKTLNFPMLATEEKLLEGIVPNCEEEKDYLKFNSREVYFYNTYKGFNFFTVAIGDYEIDTIRNFVEDDEDRIYQGDLTGKIEYGSSSILAIPTNKEFNFKLTPIVKKGSVVKTRYSPLISLI